MNKSKITRTKEVKEKKVRGKQEINLFWVRNSTKNAVENLVVYHKNTKGRIINFFNLLHVVVVESDFWVSFFIIILKY
jgi:hypothetical protein